MSGPSQGSGKPYGMSRTIRRGTRIADYVIEEQVGKGGMALVFRARDQTLQRLVAVKIMAPELAADAAFQARFLRESRAIASVEESHILPVYSAGKANGLLFIATRFVREGDLGRLPVLFR